MLPALLSTQAWSPNTANQWRMCAGSKSFIATVLSVGARLGTLHRLREDDAAERGGRGGDAATAGASAAGAAAGNDDAHAVLLPFLPKEMWLLVLGTVLPKDMCTAKHRCRRNGFKEPFRDLVNEYNVGATRRVGSGIRLEY